MQRVRPVTVGDLALICRHREEMFRDAGKPEAALADGRYLGWIAEIDGEPVAGAGMIILDWPPHFMHPEQSARGYILNVFVEPLFRRRGLARLLMQSAREEADRMKLDYLVLHASDAGRPLYDELGWTATNEMSLSLRGRKQ